jgi:hypothetical protein
MRPLHYINILFLFIGVIVGLALTEYFQTPPVVAQDNTPIYEYAYAWGNLETEGDAITLQVPELETVDSEWGQIEVYKTIDFPIAFEGGASGTEMYAINQIAKMGWELVCKYYIPEGYERGHHYWFRRVKN